MQYFPLFIDTHDLNVLMIGAGEVASRKLELLNRTEANVHIIALAVCDEVKAFESEPKVSIEQRAVSEQDIQGWDLIYIATADERLNKQLALIAKENNILVNVVDSPEDCRFITPSIIDRDKLQIAISTAGAAPVFARELRGRLESWLPQSLAPLFDFVAGKRVEVQQRLPSFKARRLFWERFFTVNGDKFDHQTPVRYEQSYETLVVDGEILLIDNETNIDWLPIAALSLLQKLDVVYADERLPVALTELIRRDARRESLLPFSQLEYQYGQGDRCLIFSDKVRVIALQAHFPMAKYLRPGSL
ncbi:precorrin-2 dehydrogenase/sirohydrochlorin ferrochelatase family protein [Shewanella surugensis]|uniref:precorrin-2 dehydrogenase n=1 Tax=Shewanella surugensis TaxID=212020 RepID=A0ABT0LHN2_9GAMM|nr:bifunctional precorrin-2 dehydrogenase/sirohydrochlorin ferrochelatase [Shewanella surugensis]MCL1127203.1 bifunctional precorrin-2 dehydrogenase/sirohydrochlorin ferrochelatase [Shewanella surugensis]